MNVVDAILEECNRVRELMPYYQELGPVGWFGLAALKECVRVGEAALASGDAGACVAALVALRECK